MIFVGTDLPDLCHMDLLNTITKLKENDVRVEIKIYKGWMHGFLTLGGAIKEVSSVITFINKKINKYL